MNTDPQNTTRRGRPARSPEQIEASRDMIIQAARDLFALHGYQGVSMRKIASKAGCLPSTLYTLFPNKKQLLHFIWESVFSDLFAALELSYLQSTDADRLQALCLTTIDFWLKRPADYQAIFLVEDQIQHPEERYFVDSSIVLPQLDVYRRAIVEAQMRGELQAGDPDEIKNILLCCIQGVVFNLVNIPEYPWGDANRIRTMTIQTMLNGLKA